VPVGDNLLAEGLPGIPLELADAVARYTEFRTARLWDWHPTRREVLIGTRFGDVVQLHHVGMPGGARTQLSFFPDRVLGARYQPTTAGYVVLSKDVGGGEFFQNYRVDLSSGDVTLLTDGRSRNSLGVWSRGGDRMAYTSTRRNGRDTDIWIIDPVDRRSDRLLAELEGGGWGVAQWSPDDRSLLVQQFISVNESHLWLVNAGTGEKRRITPQGGAETVLYADAEFAPDGRGVFATSDRGSEFQRVVHIDVATGRERPLVTASRWDVESMALSPDGSTIATVTNEEGVSTLRFLDLNGRVISAPRLPVGIVNDLRWHPSSREIGFSINSTRSPSDVYSLDVRTGALRRWTTSETGGLHTGTLPSAELVRWKSFDGRMISGFLYRPPSRFTGKRPVIINIHGGPEGQARPVFLGRLNYYLNELGVALIYPNVRGSTGYGKSFVKLDNGLKREDSYKDIAALLDWIATRGELDAGKVMVTGGSYGGFMTLAVASNYSDRICCAVDVVGISHLGTFLEKTESYRRDLRRVEYGDERDARIRAFFDRTAPLTNAHRITKPLFVVQGANDPRVPRQEAEQIVTAVRKNGTPVWFLMAMDEGHGFAKKKNADFQFYSTVMFVREFLMRETAVP
jgi:dipeptidyl aminopeptidase/acylaminoacyl peptidase